MSNPSDNLIAQATLYAAARGMQLSFQLGFGKDGQVYSTSVGSAIKAFRQRELFDRELSCYFRLLETTTHEILGFRVPQLLGFDEQLLAIEMSIVQRLTGILPMSTTTRLPPDRLLAPACTALTILLMLILVLHSLFRRHPKPKV